MFFLLYFDTATMPDPLSEIKRQMPVVSIGKSYRIRVSQFAYRSSVKQVINHHKKKGHLRQVALGQFFYVQSKAE
ncbi:hypothetical protein FC652_02505 [Vibrio sp. 05-20-BW147]|nr:hypothetical protein [Vibrio sp. 05-20-BW147]